ncbi:MAG: HNH endonuclease domain-containing protein [Cyanobacteriota bacterium]|nr:HNH endonuclease domain-containing protein [Cyanobacteriota bacterium]
MGKAGKALQQVLKTYSISQNKLALSLGVERSVVFRWFHEQVDPSAEAVAEIVAVLQQLEPDAAGEFAQLYLGNAAFARSPRFAIASHPELPPSDDVDVSVLSGLFSNTTNSYKYLFFISVLDILCRRKFEGSSAIGFGELVVEMLANAWYPHTYFKLSFGRQDMVADYLDSLDLEVEEPIFKLTDIDKKLLRQAIEAQNLTKISKKLMRFVPFRLIRPFFERELRGLSTKKDSQIEKRIPELAKEGFENYKPLYRFNSTLYKNCKVILIHPDWLSYLEQNYSIVRGWTSWQWLNYMQSRNPSVPSISSKLFPPQQRDSLSEQTKYWKRIIKNAEIRCIYSGIVLNSSNLSLDHYLPWSFVAHNRLWNLIPTIASVNSAKSNNIPAIVYFDRFVQNQHEGLTIHKKIREQLDWNKVTESYLVDLKVSSRDDLLNLEALRNAYQTVLIPLMALAENQGFATEWKYKDK